MPQEALYTICRFSSEKGALRQNIEDSIIAKTPIVNRCGRKCCICTKNNRPQATDVQMLPYETRSAATGTGTRWPLSVIFHKSKWGNTPNSSAKSH